MNKSLRPSKRDYLRYDAQRYETDGFIEERGRVRDLAQKPRYWQITATARTRDPATGEVVKHHFNIKANGRYMLSELAPVVNEQIHAESAKLPLPVRGVETIPGSCVADLGRKARNDRMVGTNMRPLCFVPCAILG